MSEIEVALVEHTVEVQSLDHVVEVAYAGAQGPRGEAGAPAIELPFSFGDATPAPVTLAAVGKFIYEVAIVILTAFNGAGAALRVGDAGVNDRLMAATENDPGTAGTYTTHPNVAYLVATTVNLTITPGAGASSGAGIVRLTIQQ